MKRPALSKLDWDAMRAALPDHAPAINVIHGHVAKIPNSTYFDPEHIFTFSRKAVSKEEIAAAIDAIVRAKFCVRRIEVRCPDNGYSLNSNDETPLFRVGAPLPRYLRDSDWRRFNVADNGILVNVIATRKPKPEPEPED